MNYYMNYYKNKNIYKLGYNDITTNTINTLEFRICFKI